MFLHLQFWRYEPQYLSKKHIEDISNQLKFTKPGVHINHVFLNKSPTMTILVGSDNAR